MTVLPLSRIQCDRCLSVHVLVTKRSDHFGMELREAGWIARVVRGRYRHACSLCADELIAEAEGRKARAS
jgi:hypothetical protein